MSPRLDDSHTQRATSASAPEETQDEFAHDPGEGLADLPEEPDAIDSLAHPDEVRRPVVEQRDRMSPRSAVGRLIRAHPELRQEFEKLAAQAGKVMPRGRNFQ